MGDHDSNSISSQLLEARFGRRRLLQLGVIGMSSLAVSSLLAACGDDDDEQDEDGSAPAAQSEPTTDEGEENSAAEEEPTETDAEPSVEDEPTAGEEQGGQPSSSGEPTEVIIAINTDWESMDPHEDTANPYLFQNIFDNLIDRDEEMQIIPALAESWENIDEVTWEFQLRQDVVFHDGTPMTAEDVAFSFNHVLDPDVASRSQPFIAMIDRAEVVDDYTVRIITSEPYPPLVPTTIRCFTIPAKAFQEMGPEEFAVNPIGTGSYKFVEWIRDDYALFERFEDCWRQQAVIDIVRTRPISETSTRAQAVRTGEVDIARRISTTDALLLNDEPDVEVREVRGLRTFFVMINSVSGGPLADYRVRQALNYAVDVEGIIEHILNGYGYPLASVTGPAEFGFNPNLETYPYDPDKARELLAEAGYADGFETTFNLPGSHIPQGEEASQAIIGFLNDIGVVAELQTAPFEQFWAAWLAGEHQGLALHSWGAQTMDADGTMGGHLDGNRRGIYYNSPESDQMTLDAMAEFDEEKRLAIYHELMAYLHEQCPWIFLWNEAQLFGVNSNLIWQPRMNESILFDTMKFA